jgi:hypothetical protein
VSDYIYIYIYILSLFAKYLRKLGHKTVHIHSLRHTILILKSYEMKLANLKLQICLPDNFEIILLQNFVMFDSWKYA